MAQGNSFELAVALPIKNNKFEFGQIKTALISEALSTNTSKSVKYSNLLYPGLQNHIQYGDSIMLGPSSNPSYKDERESLIVSGVEAWQPGEYKIHLKRKANTNKFNAGDQITAYTTGLAGGWEIPSGMSSFVKAMGIKNGPISQQKAVVYNNSEGVVGTVTGSGGKYRLSINRDGMGSQFGFGLDLLDYDYLEYLLSPLNSNNYMEFGITQVPSPTASFKVLLGDSHRGGYRKDYAQRLDLDLIKGMWNGAIIRQKLLFYGNSSDYLQDSLLIPYQYYRIGGRAYIDTLHSSIPHGGGWNFYLMLRPHENVRPDSGNDEEVLIKIGESSSNMNSWFNFSTIGMLKSGISPLSPPQLVVWFQNSSMGAGDGQADGYNYGKLHLYLDELWVEHAGGINYANTDGCLKFSRYNVWPEQGSIELGKIAVSDTESLDRTRSKQYFKARFDYVSQTFWDQLQRIISWQERGFLLNLHPYINDMPNTLTGKISISDVRKDSWDLTLRSFTLEFLES
jgi:hypothetical protein